MKKYLSILTAISFIFLPTCSPVCPTTLNTLDFWYESDIFIGYSEITMVATFRNNLDTPITFRPPETFQLWINIFGNIINPPVDINNEPSGIIVAGATFTYNLTIDVSDFTTSLVRLKFRGRCSEFGVLSPDDMPLVEVSFTCS